VSLGQPDAAQSFLKMPSGSISKNYRLHAILGAIAEADDRYADSSAEYSLALNQSSGAGSGRATVSD